MELAVDQQFNAVFLRADTNRNIQNAKVSPIKVDPKLAKAHMKLCGNRVLKNEEEESVRLEYLAEMDRMLVENPKCQGCELGAITRKYQEKMLKYVD